MFEKYDFDDFDYVLMFLIWILIIVSIIEVMWSGRPIGYIMIIMGLLFQLSILEVKKIDVG